jgi:hypothetical protein
MVEENNTFTINKNYVYALAVLLVVILGLSLYINDKVNEPVKEVLNDTDNSSVVDDKINLTYKDIFVEEQVNESIATKVPEGEFDNLSTN